MPKISIIIPVYKVEKLIHKCIESVLNQTLSDIEVILVNDGSPDKSGEICDYFATQDKRVKVIHKINGGQSSARNAGLDIATGDYIGFVDSDDWIKQDMYEVLYNNLIIHNADVSMCNRIYCYSREEVESKVNVSVTLYEKEEVIKTYLSTDMLAVWNKLFKKELFNEIRFPEGKIHEEIYLTYNILRRVDRMVISTDEKYCYYCSSFSTVRSKIGMRDLNLLKEWNLVVDAVSLEYPNLIDASKIRLYISYFDLLNKYAIFGAMDKEILEYLKKETKTWISILKTNKKLIINNDYIGNKRRSQIQLMCFSFKSFCVMKKLYVLLKNFKTKNILSIGEGKT